jgi:epoxyqueuosine reductase
MEQSRLLKKRQKLGTMRAMHEDIVRALEQTDNKIWSAWSWIPLQTPPRIDIYEDWLKQGYQGDMGYLQKHSEWKKDPQNLPGGPWQSVILFRIPYLPHPWPLEAEKKWHFLKIARYAQGYDYHHKIKETLSFLGERLKQKNNTLRYLAGTDSLPFLERNHAWLGGLGWIGKNSCLIHPKEGSFFFLAELLLNIPAPQPLPEPISDHCGHCRLCIDSCPTQAILDNRTLDATRCISYWTIESKNEPPAELQKSVGSWFFGCDICQEVCPWNYKPLLQTLHHSHLSASELRQHYLFPPKLSAEEENLLREEILFFLRASNKQILERIRGTPLERARPRGLRRNAILVAQHFNLHAQAEIQAAITSCRGRYLAWR